MRAAAGRVYRLIVLACLAACAVQPASDINAAALHAEAAADPAHTVRLMRDAGERLAGTPFLPGNRAVLLIDGAQSFAALSGAIRAARTRIDMETYEFDDTAGGAFADLLIAARARGVEVNLIHDAWGALATSGAVFDRLRRGGVRVLEYNPLLPNARIIADPNARDHRKLLCVDGAVVITGGVNITRVYETPVSHIAADPGQDAWRDTDVRIAGPVAAEFEQYFLRTWREQNGPPIAPPPPAPPPFDGGIPVQALGGTPQDGEPLIYRTLLAALALAQRSAHFTTGFFAPTPGFVDALCAAARRGVDVQLIVPARSTSDTVIAAGRAEYGRLLEAGVKLHEYEGRVLHAKTAVIDGAWSAVGSSNLDWRSTVWNNELDAILLDPRFGAEMESVFRNDVAASREVTLKAWRNRGLIERLDELKARLVDKLL